MTQKKFTKAPEEVVGVIKKIGNAEVKDPKTVPVRCFRKKGRFEFEHTVAQLDEALRYKQEVRGFVSRWCHRVFSLTYSSGRTMVDSALGVKVAGALG